MAVSFAAFALVAASVAAVLIAAFLALLDLVVASALAVLIASFFFVSA